MGSQQTMRPTGLTQVPIDYPTIPTPNKLEMLWENNYHDIYHRFSPYFDYNSGLVDKILGFGSKQPFIYDYIDEAGKGLSGLRRYESRLFPIGSGPRDVIRVTKYLASGQGVAFLGKQFLLQTGNVFNETRIYNPISPIVAAGSNFLFGTARPMRFIDIYGGLGGIAKSLLGGIGATIFGDPNTNPPPGTAKGALLPGHNLDGGKGLLRAQTANTARGLLEQRWTDPSSNKSSLWDGIKSWAMKTFANFIPATQKNITYKSDEGAYGLMVNSNRFTYTIGGTEFKLNQMWIGGGKLIRKDGQYPSQAARIFTNPDGTPKINLSTHGFHFSISGVGETGYRVGDSTNPLKPGVRYGDSVGTKVSEDYEASDVAVQYGFYVDNGKQYPTKKIDKKSVDKTKENLKKVLDALQKSGVYQASGLDPDGRVISSDNPTINGYDKIFNAKNKNDPSPKSYPYGVLSSYRWKNVRMVDSSITSENLDENSLKLPGAGNFDAINTLRVLPKTRHIKSSQVAGWNAWEPYIHDQIAFFFYDVVNDKYIPFRATVQNVNESITANWDELTFIGRADKLYSYVGFSRQLGFNFDVHIGSIVELAPTWNRINYLMSIIKPARYTKSSYDNPFNRFMVPPMVELTIGDLYKKQPVIIQSVTMNIPDDASWETLNEENSKEWNYLVNYFKSKQIRGGGKEYGQFPRHAKLTVSCYVLEKERAIAGAAHFGHAPHTDNYKEDDIISYPKMHQALVEYQADNLTVPSVKKNNTWQGLSQAPYSVRDNPAGDSGPVIDIYDKSPAKPPPLDWTEGITPIL